MTLDMNRPDLTVGVVGTGAMGRGIAQVTAQGGMKAIMFDAAAGGAAKAKAAILDVLKGLVAKGRLSDADLASVNLLLTDVMMPGMTGPEIATALQARRAGLRVLFMSGYNNESVQNILHKPFTLDTLTRRVRELLDGPPPG